MRADVYNYNSLVSGMACGDERAAATLFDEFSPILLAVSLRIVGERADAEAPPVADRG